MKYLIPLLSIISVLTLSSCKKKSEANKAYEVNVVKNCTGVYVEYKEDHFKICNDELLDEYNDGDVIKMDFKKINTCDENFDEVVCMMYFEYYSDAEIIEIY